MKTYYKYGNKNYIALWFMRESICSFRKITLKIGYRITLVRDSERKCWLLLVISAKDKEIIAKRFG